MLTRRKLLASAAPAAALAVATCGTLDPVTGVTSYGLPASVIAFIQQGVATVSSYIPTIESIVGTALSLFGPQYATLVTIGTAAINTVISTLTNLIAPPVVAAGRLHRSDRYGRRFVGWTLQHVPVYAQ
jgi:hypothetical protein